MKKIFRLFIRGSIAALLLLGGLLIYFVDSPDPQTPQLSGQLNTGTVQASGRTRTHLTYVPHALPKGAPLLLVMHGSGEHGIQMRKATGYAFERLADERKFAVVYPDGYEGYRNACNVVGDFSANKLNVDDVGYLTSLADKLITEIGVDRNRVFAMGISRGGHMAFRLALEAPSRFRAVAAVAANVPSSGNFKCTPSDQGTSSVMIMNGTKDTLNPFEGGYVSFFGFLKRGKVRSSWESGQYFADLNKISTPPATKDTHFSGWKSGSAGPVARTL